MTRMDELLQMKTEYQAITPPPELEGRVLEAMERARAAKARMAALSQLKAEYLSREVPEVLESRVKTSIKRASVKRHRNQTFRLVRNVSVAAAAAVTVFILPNSNAEVASAMSSIPVIGGFVQAITVRDYSRETAHSELSAKVPEVEVGKDETKEQEKKQGEKTEPSKTEKTPSAELPVLPPAGEENPLTNEEGEPSSNAAAQVNDSVQAYIQTLLDAFRRDEATGGYVALTTDYRVVTNTDDWFTLEISSSYTKADCVERLRYYHIDKHTGRVANLGDAFYDDAQWRTVVNSAIDKQINERIKAGEDFFTKKEAKIYGDSFAFESISDDANFYFDEDGNIVIVIDSGEIAPESTGTVFFTVKTSSLKDMLRYDMGRERQTSSGHETTEEGTSTEETTGGAQDVMIPGEPVIEHHHDEEVDERRPEGSSGTSTEIVIEDEDIEQAIEEEVDDRKPQGNSGTEVSEEAQDAESAASADTSDSDTINETQIEDGGDEEPSIEPQAEIETENESETAGEVAED